MGIFDDVLAPHLEMVSEVFRQDHPAWLYFLELYRTDKFKSEQKARERETRNVAAERFRERGNYLFTAKKYAEAVGLYTESIASAKDGPLASMAYFNRSAALFYMKLYEDCIKDIDRALAAGYPKLQNLYNLHLRKAKCLKFLKEEHSGCLADATKAILLHNKDDINRLSDLLVAKMAEPEPIFIAKLIMPNNVCEVPALSYGQNPEVPSFSSAVSLEYSKSQGRHLIAKRNIEKGDTLIVEEGFVHTVFSHEQSKVCHVCFKYCFTLIPCIRCGDSLYCSDLCRETDWSRAHEGICNKHRPFNRENDDFDIDENLSEVPPSLTVLIQVIGRIGLDHIIQTALENRPMPSLLGNQRTKGFHDGKFQVATLEALLSLGDLFNTLPEIVLQVASQIVIEHCITLEIPKEKVPRVAAILLKLFLVIQNNVMTIFGSQLNYNGQTKTVFLGNTLNLASSLVNHSCDPNMCQVSYGTTTVFKAKRPIRKGEQLTYSYLKSAMTLSIQERQEELYENYKFHCTCLACV